MYSEVRVVHLQGRQIRQRRAETEGDVLRCTIHLTSTPPCPATCQDRILLVVAVILKSLCLWLLRSTEYRPASVYSSSCLIAAQRGKMVEIEKNLVPFRHAINYEEINGSITWGQFAFPPSLPLLIALLSCRVDILFVVLILCSTKEGPSTGKIFIKQQQAILIDRERRMATNKGPNLGQGASGNLVLCWFFLCASL